MNNCYILPVVFMVTSTANAVVPRCGYSNSPATKIVGGVETEKNEYPWQVGLFSTLPRYRSSPAFFFCGGSIISERWILTAAHCFTHDMTSKNTFVDVGEHDWSKGTETNATKRYFSEEISINPYYNPDTYDSDMALIKLTERLSFDQYNRVAPICPPSNLNELYGRSVNAIVTGWGRLSYGGSLPKSLREVEVTTMANSDCDSDYQGQYAITHNMLCADVPDGGRDSCEGDSGGPLIIADGLIFRQIGVVSFGKGCADPRYPGVYARITSQWNWITKTISPTIWRNPTGRECSSPWFPLGGQCFLVPPEERTWSEARSYCREQTEEGGDLATPTADNIGALRDYLFEYHGGLIGLYWLGASDSDGEMTWVNGGGIVTSGLIPDFPSIAGGGQACIAMFPVPKLGDESLGVFRCSETKDFVCMAQPS